MTKMLTSFDAPLILAQQAGQGSPNPGYGQLIFFGLLFAAMYFLMIAPQRKKQKEHEKMLAALSSGDEVVTSGGIYGTITNVKEDRFVLRVADNTKIEVGKAFISTVVSRANAETKK